MRLKIEADGVWLEMGEEDQGGGHILGMDKLPSPNFGQTFYPGLPDTIVLHYTAGGGASALRTLRDPNSRVSAHFFVYEAGWICQLVSLDRIAWHCGKSKWGDRTSINLFSIGIEMVNPGKLQPRAGSWYTWWGQEWPVGNTYHEENGTAWGAYPVQQVNAVMALCQVIARELPISVLVGHEEISPGRKEDPGPAFASLDSFREVVLGSVAPPNPFLAAADIACFGASMQPSRNADPSAAYVGSVIEEVDQWEKERQGPAATPAEPGTRIAPQDMAKPVRERLSAVLDALKALGSALLAVLSALSRRNRP